MKKKQLFLVSVLVVALLRPVIVWAQTSSSTNYQVNEAYFGTGGDVNASSGSYQVQGGLGSLGVGEASSSSYGAFGGFITPADEYLEMVVNQSTIDLGTLSPSATATGTGTFYVRAYINGSYNVITVSNPPTNESGASINAKSTAAAPAIGSEEFGINLVDNTAPNIGNNPAPAPNSTYANGEAAPGYNAADNFKYGVGDIIARSGSGRAWGQTNFTISYIANIADTTPAGLYVMHHDLVVIATF